MIIRNINSFKSSKKEFLSKKEINKLMNEVYTKILKTKNLKKNKSIKFLQSRKIFDQEYYKLKKNNKKWSNIYNSFKNLKSHKRILEPKIRSYLKNKMKKKFSIVNSQLRIIEKSDKRSYPVHQELVTGKKNLIVFWIALHEIKKKEGGLVVYNKRINKEFKHLYNKMNYPYLDKQKKFKNNCKEKTFKKGEALILGKFIPHGTAPKLKGPPRWAAIVRIST